MVNVNTTEEATCGASRCVSKSLSYASHPWTSHGVKMTFLEKKQPVQLRGEKTEDTNVRSQDAYRPCRWPDTK